MFGVYTYHTVNNDVDNPLFGDPNMTPSQRLYQFVKYDLWMAAYILFIVALVVLLCVTVGMASSCTSDLARGVFGLCIVLFVYLGIGLLICMGYVAVDAFKEWAGECLCWMVPCMWPCLFIGCCLKAADDMEKDWKHKQIQNNSPANADVEHGAGGGAYPAHQHQPVLSMFSVNSMFSAILCPLIYPINPLIISSHTLLDCSLCSLTLVSCFMFTKNILTMSSLATCDRLHSSNPLWWCKSTRGLNPSHSRLCTRSLYRNSISNLCSNRN